MLMISRATAWVFLLLSPSVYAQSDSLERPAADFASKGVGLTETILKFAHEEHLPVAVEFPRLPSTDKLTSNESKIRACLPALVMGHQNE